MAIADDIIAQQRARSMGFVDPRLAKGLAQRSIGQTAEAGARQSVADTERQARLFARMQAARLEQDLKSEQLRRSKERYDSVRNRLVTYAAPIFKATADTITAAKRVGLFEPGEEKSLAQKSLEDLVESMGGEADDSFAAPDPAVNPFRSGDVQSTAPEPTTMGADLTFIGGGEVTPEREMELRNFLQARERERTRLQFADTPATQSGLGIEPISPVSSESIDPFAQQRAIRDRQILESLTEEQILALLERKRGI